jgi:hypothetical protein
VLRSARTFRARVAFRGGLLDPSVGLRTRSSGLALADQLAELTSLLSDPGQSTALRRPVAEDLTRLEEELDAILSAMGQLGRADRQQRAPMLTRLAARLEVDRTVPNGLYAT